MRHNDRLLTRILSAVLAAACAAGCSASLPTEATRPPVLTELVLFNRSFSSLSLGVGQDWGLDAYAVDSDGAYRYVTAEAVWATSDPALAQVRGAGSIAGVRPGIVEVTARYQALAASRIVEVELVMDRFPRLVLGFSLFPPRTIGVSTNLTARFNQSTNNFQDVTNVAVWTSSNERVLTVSSQGLMTAVGVGTAEIRVSFNGLVTGIRHSVPPRTQ